MLRKFRRTSFFEFATIFLRRYKKGNISNNGIVLAYYTLLSFFPLLLLIGNVLPLLDLPVNTVLKYINRIMPENIYKILSPLVKQLLTTNSGGVLSIGVVVALWSASKGVNAFQQALNATYDMENTTNAILTRILSFLIVLLFMVALIVIVLSFSFGQVLLSYLAPILQLPPDFVSFLEIIKWPVTILGVGFILTVLYMIVPIAKVRWRYVWPGALFAMSGLVILTQFFTLYLRYFGGEVTTYKTIGTFIVIMLWLDLLAEIMLIGGVINAALQEQKMGLPFKPKLGRLKRTHEDVH
ncbi:YihY/virulence factor BrkB family protein [Pediococcus inopinatus]|uniref:YihY/virulence factor BrkB family protein n=1 Tax=Pediococcus inopinatus TaxID=114090 RepID=UPI00070E29A4|nr:YihY/virulence factor BrkB family protein [Pediococcus inopinatus]AVL00550.1 hypothetical protein PI20285_07850 [Pediococcus inopinatus]